VCVEGVNIYSLIEIYFETRGATNMLERSIAKKSIASIRNKKLNLNPNTEMTERIKLLQREMVKLSFQKNKKDDIGLIVDEINRLRLMLKMSN